MFFKLLLFIILLITRFWGLNWGGDFHFHPDENNMAWAVERLSMGNLNPEFWAYGQFPLYLSFFSKKLIGGQTHLNLRFWSAIFSVLTVIVGYLLAKEISKKDRWGLITGILLTFTPGLIQIAHFGTTESLLTFVGFSSAYLAVKYYQSEKLKYLILAALVGAMGMASKLSAVLFLAGPFLAIILRPKRFKRLFLWGGLTVILTVIFSPYYILKFENFWGTFRYESNVARGISPTFYTRQFIDTKPFLFQLTKIFPWVLGLPMFSLLLVSTARFILNLVKDPLKKIKSLITNHYLLVTTFFPWFIFNSFLFAKWTRFIIPILPFLVLFVVWGLKEFKVKNEKVLDYLLIILLISPGVLFIRIYFQKDIRVRACQWMNKNLPQDSTIVYEGGNIVDLPNLDHQKFETIGVDFYHLDDNKERLEKLEKAIEEADYFFSPSRRIFTNHLRLPEKFPRTAKFYQQLFSGQLGFKKIKEFHPFGPISRFLVGSDLNSEETWTVFDHPTPRLWKKQP